MATGRDFIRSVIEGDTNVGDFELIYVYMNFSEDK